MEISDTTKENSNWERPPGGEAERFVWCQVSRASLPRFKILSLFLFSHPHLFSSSAQPSLLYRNRGGGEFVSI